MSKRQLHKIFHGEVVILVKRIDWRSAIDHREDSRGCSGTRRDSSESTRCLKCGSVNQRCRIR